MAAESIAFYQETIAALSADLAEERKRNARLADDLHGALRALAESDDEARDLRRAVRQAEARVEVLTHRLADTERELTEAERERDLALKNLRDLRGLATGHWVDEDANGYRVGG